MRDALLATLGFAVLQDGPEAKVEGRVGEGHLNRHGTAHGGFLYALADCAFALASNARGPAVALSCRMDYFRPVALGARVVAEAKEVHLARRTATYQVELFSEGKRVALFTGTVFRLGGEEDVPEGAGDPAQGQTQGLAGGKA